MYLVTMDYNVYPKEARAYSILEERWVIKEPDLDSAISMAISNVKTVARSKHGWETDLIVTNCHVDRLKECVRCNGSGRTASFGGYNICPACNGDRYVKTI